MRVIDFITEHPDIVIMALATIGGWLGIKRNAKKRAATLQEVERWARAAADVLDRVVAAGVLKKSHAELVAKGLREFHTLAQVAGVLVSEEHELRAKAVLLERLNQLAAERDEVARAALGGAANEIMDDLRRWQNHKGKAYRGGLGVNVTTIDPHTGARTSKSIPPDPR